MTNTSPNGGNKELNFGEWVHMAVLLSLPSVIAGVLLFLCQCHWYLQTGLWTSHSFIELLVWLHNGGWQSIPWAVKPHSWYGLHSLLVSMPLSVGLIVFAPLIGYALVAAIVLPIVLALAAVAAVLFLSIPWLLTGSEDAWWAWAIAASEVCLALWFTYKWLSEKRGQRQRDSQI